MSKKRFYQYLLVQSLTLGRIPLILIFLGGKQLYVRWRRPVKSTNSLNLEDDE